LQRRLTDVHHLGVHQPDETLYLELDFKEFTEIGEFVVQLLKFLHGVIYRRQFPELLQLRYDLVHDILELLAERHKSEVALLHELYHQTRVFVHVGHYIICLDVAIDLVDVMGEVSEAIEVWRRDEFFLTVVQEVQHLLARLPHERLDVMDETDEQRFH